MRRGGAAGVGPCAGALVLCSASFKGCAGSKHNDALRIETMAAPDLVANWALVLVPTMLAAIKSRVTAMRWNRR